MQGQVLILSALEVFLESHVDRLDAEEGHGVKDSQMVPRDDFHVGSIARVHEHLHNFFDLFVCENIKLVVLDELVVHDSFYFTGQSKTCKL